MAEVLNAVLKSAQAIQNLNSDTAKVRSLEFMTGLVAVYALKKAYEGRTIESGESLGVAGTMWALHGHVIGHNLHTTSVVLTSQCDRLEGQLELVNAEIDSLRQIQVKGGQLLGEQEAQLKLLEDQGQRASIEKDIEVRKELLQRTEKQIQRLEESVRDITEELRGKKVNILALVGEAESKLRALGTEESSEKALALARSVKALAEAAQSLIEAH